MPQTGLTLADSVVPASHTHMESASNNNRYGVISGCGVTLDAADLTFDIAAGAILHNGKSVAVAAQANAATLVADGSNPRFTVIALDSTGVVVAIASSQGTAASAPVPPDQGDWVPLMLVRIAAGATVASSQTNYDVRVPVGQQIWRTTAADTTNASETLTDVAGALFYVGASEVWEFTCHGEATIGATPDIKVAFTVPSGATCRGVATKIDAAGVANAAGDLTSATALASAAAGIGLRITGTVVNSTTAGIVQLQAAQNTSTVEDTIIAAGFAVVAHRVL